MELDIRETKDGILVVSHDPTIDRMTMGTGYIRDMGLGDLRMFHIRGSGEKTPTAGEVFDEIVSHGKPGLVQVDLKVSGVGMRLLEHIYGRDLEDVTVISAFHKHLLEEIRALDKKISTGLIRKLPFNGPIDEYIAPETGEGRWKIKAKQRLHLAYLLAMLPVNRLLRPRSFDLIEEAKRLGADHVMCWWGAASAHFVRTAHGEGMKVVVGITNSRRGIERMERIGVDAIVTDRADLLRP